MKFACVFLCAAFCLGSVAYTTALVLWPPTGITCAAPVYDFGVVPADNDASVDSVFLLRNNGGRSLTIGRVVSSCGCLVPADLSGTVIPPGAEVRLPVVLKLRNLRGAVAKTILVEIDGRVQAPIILTLKGQIQIS